ncbi:MAG TPA: HAMP domain-containing sensor histidine kinase [Terriglobia bacterium]|nr:HAMP domain-containing sensor histidine kinase [Terriglobia bacterium]
MKKATSLRFQMMVLFCTLFGVLLGGSYLAFWVFLEREVHAQLNRQLQATARPIIADLIAEPNVEDVNQLNLPEEYFELLDPAGRVLQHSKNIEAPLDMKGISLQISAPVFRIGADARGNGVRVALIPFQQADQARILAVAIPTVSTNQVLDSFGRAALLLFPLSLLVTALISTWYVGRSLAPITALTRQAALMAERVTNREGFWTPLAVASRHDEMGRLAATFNQLLQGVDSALRQLRQFVTDASHELRTPLSVLHGETELLLSRSRTAEEYRKTLCGFDDELKKLTRIVEGLFTLSMADAGQLRLEREPLYLNEVLEEACALVSPRAQAKNICVSTDLKEEILYNGDEAFLRQLFLIFLDNAIKYSAPQTAVRVTLASMEGKVRVRFEDHGIGIACEHLPRIFERFYRAAPSGNGEAQSGGLGLAIAQAIARAQSGSIECESKVGVGSSFTVILPAAPSAAIPSETRPAEKLTLR